MKLERIIKKLNESQKDSQLRTTLHREKEGMVLGSDEAILER
jgi:hypothetical protein